MAASGEGLLLTQLEAIAKGLSETFAPFCEVVVHDLKNPNTRYFPFTITSLAGGGGSCDGTGSCPHRLARIS